MMKTPDSFHAPSGRRSESEVIQSYQLLKSQEFIANVLNALPHVVTVLNEDRQVVFTNASALQKFNIHDLTRLLGKRPGEIVNCIHSTRMPGGCGTTENCKVCGAVNTILESISTGKKVQRECRITTENNDNLVAIDFEVMASPFEFEGNVFTIFSMIDISNEKRRRVLEKIFFHDILNTAGSIAGFLDIIKERNNGYESTELFDIVTGLSREIIEEINSQRILLLAETGELKLNTKLLEVPRFLQDIRNEFKTFEKNKCEIVLFNPHDVQEILTDRTILSRIIRNMVKNALEASSARDAITLSVEDNGGQIRFGVHNPAFIPRELQLQIFSRSFSTKGSDRGIGTYSMKLLAENYLKGKILFTSTETGGTWFYFDHPVY